MDYQEYFDSLIDVDIYQEKDKLLKVLAEQYDNDEVKAYGIEEMVFEFLLALNEKDDFSAMYELQQILQNHYPEAWNSELGQFVEILTPHYFAQQRNDEAKALFDEWVTKNYDYDSMLIVLNQLIHYGKASWVADYIAKDFFKIKNSPELIPGAESDLAAYKVMIEVGAFQQGTKNSQEVLDELTSYEVTPNVLTQQFLAAEDTPDLRFATQQGKYVFQLLRKFEKYLNEKHSVPFLTSAVVSTSLSGYFGESKYHNATTYFKIQERDFEHYMKENSFRGLRLNREANFAMLLFLPALAEFLVEENIFAPSDLSKERKKASVLLRKLQKEDPVIWSVFKASAIYQSLGIAN